MIPKNTYLLTSTGWNLIQNLKPGDKISCIQNGRFIFSTITEIKEQTYSGPVYTVNKSILLPRTKVITKKNMLKNIENFKKYELLKPKYTYYGYRLNPIIHNNTMFDTCLILKFIGYFIDCGKLEENEIITLKNNENKLNKISNILKLLDIQHSTSINKDGMLLTAEDETLYDFLLQFGSERKRHIPRKFLDLDKYYLRYLLSCMFDSSTTNNVEITKDYKIISEYNAMFNTNSNMVTNDLHEIIVKLGFYFNTTLLYFENERLKRKQYDPTNCSDMGNLDTRLLYKYKHSPVTKSKIDTLIYSFTAAEKFKVFLIRNNSKHLWINT